MVECISSVQAGRWTAFVGLDLLARARMGPLLLLLLAPSLLVPYGRHMSGVGPARTSICASAAGGWLSLPPASGGRDLAAEASEAARRLAASEGRSLEDAAPAQRPLRLISCPAGPEFLLRFDRHFGDASGGGGKRVGGGGGSGEPTMVELIAEEVSEITQGRLKGSTWLKPVAMRILRTDGKPAPGSSSSSDFTLFSTLAPSLVAPTTVIDPLDAVQARGERHTGQAHTARRAPRNRAMHALHARSPPAIRSPLAPSPGLSVRRPASYAACTGCTSRRTRPPPRSRRRCARSSSSPA